MPDYTPNQKSGLPEDMRMRYVDMGDGTHALVRMAREEAIQAVREGRCIDGWINGGTTYSSQTVLTDAGFVANVPQGERLIITDFSMALNTASDWLHVEFGYTDQEDGAGTFTPLTRKYIIKTGSNATRENPFVVDFTVPLCVKYANGARSFTARVQTKDDNAEVYIGFRGWHEKDYTA
jgi:hypothetical protein